MVAITLALAWTLGTSQAEGPWVPQSLRQWVESSPRNARLQVDQSMNPFCLRGDFDGDGHADYAFKVKFPDSGTESVAICASGRALRVLGREGTPEEFFGEKQKVFLPPWWMVMSQAEAMREATGRGGARRPIPKITGDAIAVIWESGTGLIYFDGHDFRWSAPTFGR